MSGRDREPAEIARLTTIRDEGRLTFVTGRHALAPGIEIIEVGGHTPGELIVAVSTATGRATTPTSATASLRTRTIPP